MTRTKGRKAPTRFFDAAQVVIHVDEPGGGGRTLCGVALEGTEDDAFTELVEVQRGKISCHDCIAIIAYAKEIPARFIRKPKQASYDR